MTASRPAGAAGARGGGPVAADLGSFRMGGGGGGKRSPAALQEPVL